MATIAPLTAGTWRRRSPPPSAGSTKTRSPTESPRPARAQATSPGAISPVELSAAIWTLTAPPPVDWVTTAARHFLRSEGGVLARLAACQPGTMAT